MRAVRDRYGFFFWLLWIVWFAGSFILAALGWTGLLQAVFGKIEGPELTVTWVVATFGSWFLLVIPFMRKKERIWKRLNDDQERAVDAWLWGMSGFIGLLILSAFAWSLALREAIRPEGMQAAWAKAVFGSWLVILVPFLVLMYRKADAIFTRAVARQTYEPKYRTHFVERGKRLLPEPLAGRLKSVPPVLPNGHVVTLVLKNGRRIPHAFISRGEVLGVYDLERPDFEARDIVDLEPLAAKDLPAYDEAKWLRLDQSKINS
jgi:hypothetical protein